MQVKNCKSIRIYFCRITPCFLAVSGIIDPFSKNLFCINSLPYMAKLMRQYTDIVKLIFIPYHLNQRFIKHFPVFPMKSISQLTTTKIRRNGNIGNFNL